jgi:light-regulated signal transduction histidine kinase (bacteriophytochrome)
MSCRTVASRWPDTSVSGFDNTLLDQNGFAILKLTGSDKIIDLSPKWGSHLFRSPWAKPGGLLGGITPHRPRWTSQGCWFVMKECCEVVGAKIDHRSDEPDQAADGAVQINQELMVRTRELEQARQELSQINGSWEARVGERTAQLEAANKALVATNKQLESFGYSLAHDLKNSLTTVSIAAEMLMRDPAGLKSEQQNWVRYITDGGQRMQRVIDSMHTLSCLDRAKLVLRPIDLSVMAREIIGEFQRGEPGRKIEAWVAPQLYVRGDAQLLRMVLENLLRNAWKFTAKKEEARIEFGSQLLDGTEVCFVRDNGVGFSMTNVGKIFHAFQRLHNQADFPGAGLGLAIVRRIIERHGGNIWAESAEEKGTTFYFSLPASK